MKRLFTALLSAALLLSLAACGGTGSSGSASSGSAAASSASLEETPPAEPLPFTLAWYPEFSLHPTLAANRANLTLAPLLYESLFTVDAAFQAQPVLCQSYTVSEDKLVWTFTLRAGITFSDGTPLTAQEAADALNLARSAGSRYQERLSDVTAVTPSEANPYQFTITLRRANGALPLRLDIPIALGREDRPAGTGPYVLAEDERALTARNGWWQSEKSMPVSTILLRAVTKSDELIYAFDAGEISLVDVDLMATNAMGYGGNYQTWDYCTTDFLYLGFNTRSGIFRSADARRAVWLAVDRDTIATTIYTNHAISTLLPVHPASELYQLGESPLTYDPESLALLMEELRLTDSELVFVVNSENVAKSSAAQLIVYQLNAAGFQVDLRQLSFEDYTAALKQRNFDLYMAETVFTADFDLGPLLSSGGALNYGGWWTEGSDQLFQSPLGAAEDKAACGAELFDLLHTQAPIVPILFKNGSVLTQWGQLSDLLPVRGNVFYAMEHWVLK
ncbi:MAG: peptide ABC transporter substrate-binding protein [Lawsonibacter sp.]|jgi:peptide/nickel transport system substrate-binding protein|nr:peptide ABC transporter substrate-binding protein [Lawsonibacter sp.]MCI9268090.1 peptide ABC transporter substrate-binding protein [Lawsonibacter sp.]